MVWESMQAVRLIRGSIGATRAQASSSSGASPPEATATATPDAAATTSAADLEQEENIARMHEEAHCRALLDGMRWALYVPDTEEHRLSLQQLGLVATEYVECFSNATIHELGKHLELPLSCRVWLSETRRALDQMAKFGWMPRFVTHVHDKFIRTHANNAPETWHDPGNYVLDVAVNALRLWQFVNVSHAAKVTQVSQATYGSSANKSAKGPVNLRGNILEALLGHCQNIASERR